MRTHSSARAAGVIVGLEGVAVVVLVIAQVLALSGGDAGDPTSGIALIVLTAVGAVALLAFALAILRGQSWGRSGGIVSQLLILAVALGAVTGADANPLIALALAVPAVLTLALLIVAARRAGADRSAAQGRGRPGAGGPADEGPDEAERRRG
ncbi:histidine kinase [Microbacterium rhizomatis]|uniref:Histidine kinase n=1 Tax=Microbacterium rhizomatis TaxID=1631477 RepID=A0A5J5J580_9MICO|nr:histidine kinase [Microbacterium rhizomatis]KAA9111190.1 histidine kinase [Microbacterium rhizomatis]